MMWRTLVAAISLCASCGDDAVRGGDGRDTANAPDTRPRAEVFVPLDSTSAPEIADAADATPEPDTRPALDTSIPPDVVEDSTAPETSVSPDVADTTDASEVIAPRSGDDCAGAWILADEDHDRHYDALGNVGPLGKLLDDSDATACGVDDATVNGTGKADELWRFTAPEAGRYQIGLLSDTSIDLVLYVLAGSECDGACLGYDDSGAVGDIDTLTLTLSAGQTITIVVDGKTTAHAGAYLVDVYACTPDDCVTP